MCAPKPPKPQTIPERQAVQLPDNGATAARSSDTARRRRGMMATVIAGNLGAPATTASTTLGG